MQLLDASFLLLVAGYLSCPMFFHDSVPFLSIPWALRGPFSFEDRILGASEIRAAHDQLVPGCCEGRPHQHRRQRGPGWGHWRGMEATGGL